MVSQTLADHVLRTLAAVPVPESVLVIGDGTRQLRANLSSLGFQVMQEGVAFEPGGGGDGSEFGWLVVVVQSENGGDLRTVVSGVRSRVRPGGWLVVGIEGHPDDKRVRASGRALISRIEGTGYALAEALTRHPGGYHAILRRLDEDTVA